MKRDSQTEIIAINDDTRNLLLIKQNKNKELTDKIPIELHDRIFVSNNMFKKNKNDVSYIVIKIFKKKDLKLGEIKIKRREYKIHSILYDNNFKVMQPMGFYEDHNEIGLTFEYAKNSDLLTQLNYNFGQKINILQDIKWFNFLKSQIYNILNVLNYMHYKCWAHKDLTLENILINEKFEFHLHDFEYTQIYNNEFFDDNHDSNTLIDIKDIKTNQWSGKIEHMSPENYSVFKNGSKSNKFIYDPFSDDIWSFGIILTCIFSDQPFLWKKPDYNDKKFNKILKNIRDELHSVFKIEKQNNKFIKTQLLMLIDLLSQIFVPEKQRLTSQQLISHPFFKDFHINKSNKNSPKQPKKSLLTRIRQSFKQES